MKKKLNFQFFIIKKTKNVLTRFAILWQSENGVKGLIGAETAFIALFL